MMGVVLALLKTLWLHVGLMHLKYNGNNKSQPTVWWLLMGNGCFTGKKLIHRNVLVV